LVTSIIFVHGTGVRDGLTFNAVKAALPNWNVIHCFWGEPYGVRLNHGGGSILDYEPIGDMSEENKIESQWELIYRDPLYELRHLTALPGEQEELPFNQIPPWDCLKAHIQSYQPSEALSQQLKCAQLNDVWAEAFGAVIHSNDFETAVQKFTSDDDQTIKPIARAIVASLIVAGVEKGCPLPDGDTRDDIVKRLALDFGQEKYLSILETAVSYLCFAKTPSGLYFQ
jgi:hypothetical protein